jgi:hypothetical protein
VAAMSGDRVPISAEVRGRYRVWRAETARSSSRIEEVLYGERFGAATGDFTQRKGKGRERAATHLRRLAESAGARFVDRDEWRLRWSYLRVGDDRIVPVLMTVDRANNGFHPWVLSPSDHSLQRALQRAAPGLDLTELIWDAVDSARRISIPFLLSRTALDRFRVEAGEGAFACNMTMIEMLGNEMPIIEAETWLSRDQMSRVQEAEVVAEGHPGERLDDVYAEFREEWCVPPIHRSRRELGRRI